MESVLTVLQLLAIAFHLAIITLMTIHPGRRAVPDSVRFLMCTLSALAATAFLISMFPNSVVAPLTEYIQPLVPLVWVFLVYTYLREVSQRELALERSRFRTVVEDMPVMMVAVDDDLNMVLWNKQCERVTGYAEDEIVGNPEYRDLLKVDSEYHERMLADYERRGNDFADWEWEIRCKNGEIRTIAWSSVSERIRIPGWTTWAVGVDVTERRKAEEQSARNQEMLELAIEGSGGGVWDLALEPLRGDALRDEIYISPRLKSFLGFGHDEFPDSMEALEERVHPDDLLELEKSIQDHMAGRTPLHHAEYRVRHRDGTYRWFLTRGLARRDEDGNILRWSGVTWDTTETRRSAERLRESEQRFRTLAETNTAGIWHINSEGYTEYLNPAMMAMLEVDGIEALSDVKVFDFFTEESQRILAAELSKRPEGKSSAYEVMLAGAKGTQRNVLISGAPFVDGTGQFRGSIGTFTDITALKKAQQELAAEREFSYSALNTLPGVFLLFNVKRRLLMWNETLEKELGYESDELVHIDVVNLVAEEDREAARLGAVRAIEGGEYWTEVSLRIKGGQSRPFLFRGKRHVYRGAPCVLAIGMDIHAQKEAEAEQRRLREQLLQSQKLESIGLLAGGVAHDFNNLLTAIIGYAHLLDEEIGEDGSAREALAEIRRAGEQAAALTRQLLAFSRRQELHPKVINLRDIVAGMEKMIGRLIGEDIRVHCELDPDVPPVKADPGQIEQVLVNLAVNARDAMPHGGALRLSLSTVSELSELTDVESQLAGRKIVRLSVADTGLGMDEETRQKIFEPFFTTKERHKGTGLGLSTVFGIVKQSGGEIEVKSEVGRGTAFHLYFPITDEQPQPDTPLHPEASDVAQGTETILLIEDDPAPRALAVEVLRKQGYTVIEAADDTEALELSHRYDQPIDMILTDVILPERTGLEVAKLIQRERRKARILFMSGYTDGKLADAELGPNLPFLQKPFTPHTLARSVREVLDAKPVELT